MKEILISQLAIDTSNARAKIKIWKTGGSERKRLIFPFGELAREIWDAQGGLV